MPIYDDILEVWREFTVYNTANPLPIGDPTSGKWNPTKAQIRNVLIGILQTLGDEGALNTIIAQLALKADLANRGAIFGSSAGAIAAGQDRLPTALARIWTVEGTFASPVLVLRTPGGSAEEESLFPTAPFWNPAMKIDPDLYMRNSGRFFGSRADAVAFGQSRLPALLNKIITIEGTFAAPVWVIRTPGDGTGPDPLFATAPHWSVLDRLDVNGERIAREAAVAPLRAALVDVRTVNGVTPIIVDVAAGVVTVWEEGGRLYGPGLGGGGGGGGADMAAVRAYAQPRSAPLDSELPIFTDNRSLWLYRHMMGQLRASVADTKVRVILDGDSWMGMGILPSVLRDRYGQDYPLGGYGWWPSVPGARFANPGAGYARTGTWEIMDITVDASAIPNPMPYGTGIDGHMLTTTATDAQALFTNVQLSELRIYSRNYGGSFRYSINGGAPITVTHPTGGGLTITTITGMNPTGNNTITIDTVGNTGRVAIAGYYLTKPGIGVELLNAGNGGSMGVHWSLIAPNIQAIGENLQPHLRITTLGTNDHRYISGVSSFIQGIRASRDAWRAAAPDMGFVYICPARSNGSTIITPLADLRDALYEFCIQEKHEFYNMYDDWPAFAPANARGMWADTVHPTLAGYQSAVPRLYNQLLKV